MAHEPINLNTRNPAIRVVLLVLLLVAGVWSYYVVRWYIGNTLAEYFNPAEGSLDIANRAVSMAPNDPMTHWRIAQMSQRNLPLDQQAKAVAEYEKAVSLSPYDYRYWMTLGTALEQVGEPVRAEEALRRAVALAPSYSYPHWYLGNLLLRNARYDEAFAELQRASVADPELQSQLFNLVWEVYADDFEAVKKALGPNPASRANFALYLVNRKLYEQALRLWNTLSIDEKISTKNTGAEMIGVLISNYRFHNAVEVWNGISDEKYHSGAGQVFDGGFEALVEYGPNTVFGWQIVNSQQFQIGIDPNRSHSGSRSLRLVFQARSDLNGTIMSQLVPVQPNTTYDLECYFSTDKLDTGSGPQIQIIDATSNGELGVSTAAPGGTSQQWKPVNVSFKTGDKTEAVVLKIIRLSCGTEEAPVCPIFGSIWYDDFSFKRRD
jgi:tetratricopeptide (TPR) repeat protein